MPPFDLEYTTPTPSTLVNRNNQTEMYPSPVNIPSPSPTSSHRVSKAMKGKRVHACERPGCSKVSTLGILPMDHLAYHHNLGFYQS